MGCTYSKSSDQSSLPFSQLIGQIINTEREGPDFDLVPLIAAIDSYLAHCKINQGKSSKHKKSTADWLSFSSNAVEISEGVSESVRILANELYLC
ncbi:uncharacterized protein LOC131028059 [Cryptomeria japonica]|uniref:uncharacterized protein LOC131028059 n=1 Tax=Cryptomeria japonica TaxID=3369 RepID=UPI0027DA92CA|nr:uncharacterized protein LOC131028059 [Cryptomeria japonica]